jgi:Myo-inositol-1-phosphate synthase
MHWEFGGHLPYEIEVAAAFNINQRKVGKDISEAIFSFLNCIIFFLSECSTDRDKGKCRPFQETESKTGKYLST